MKANGVRESHAGLNDTRESKWWFLKSICSIEWRVLPEWTGNLGMVIGWDAIVLHHVNYSMSALTDITLHSAGIQSVFCEKWRSQSHGSSSPALPLDPNWDVRRGDRQASCIILRVLMDDDTWLCSYEKGQCVKYYIYSWSQKLLNLQNVDYVTKIRGIMQHACYCLFSTDLNKIFHIKDV